MSRSDEDGADPSFTLVRDGARFQKGAMEEDAIGRVKTIPFA